MKIMCALAMVVAGMLATAGAQATSTDTTSINRLVNKDHKCRQCSAGYCAMAPTGQVAQF